MIVQTLLPPNRTPFESAVATLGGERRALPTDLVASVWNPLTCPADLLSYLAWGLSVDVWDEAWPETKKREVCRNAFKLHRLKTTPAGVKAHVALAGAEVRKIVRPPATGFIYAAMTPEQKRAWLDILPQVRVYPYYNRSTAVRRAFLRGPGARHQYLVGHMRKSRGLSLYGKRATIYDRGVETPVAYEALDGNTVERVFIGSRRKRNWLGTAHVGTGYIQSSSAEKNTVTIRVGDAAPSFAIGRGVAPVDVQPQRIAQGRIAPKPRAFLGRPRFYPTNNPPGLVDLGDGATLEGITLGRDVGQRFLKRSHAPLMIYDRVSLYDQTRVGARRKTRSHLGHMRLGIPEFTAEMKIFVPMKRHKRRAAKWLGVGHLRAASMAPLHKAIEAVRVSKAFRDTVLIDTTNYGRVKFSGGLRFGEFTFGEIKEVA